MVLWLSLKKETIELKGTFWNTYRCVVVTGISFYIIYMGKVGLLVRLGCYNKLPQTRSPMNSRDLLLTVLEAGSLSWGQGTSRVGCSSSSGQETSCCILTWQRGLGIFLEPLWKGTNPIREASAQITQVFPKGPTY